MGNPVNHKITLVFIHEIQWVKIVWMYKIKK